MEIGAPLSTVHRLREEVARLKAKVAQLEAAAKTNRLASLATEQELRDEKRKAKRLRARHAGLIGRAEVWRKQAKRARQSREKPVKRKPPAEYHICGDPNWIGEHEVPAIRCVYCNKPLPWALVKGWR